MSNEDYGSHQGSVQELMEQYEDTKKQTSEYWKGFFYAFVLTLGAFGLAWQKSWTGWGPFLVIMGLALVQIMVHVRYFLHIKFNSQQYWEVLCLVLTAVLVFIVITGSVWVMYHMNMNMMLH